VGINGADAVQVTDTETFFAVFSPDGKQFVCFYQDDPKAPVKLAIFPISGGQPVKTFSSPSGLGSTLRWTPEGRSIAYVAEKDGVGNIWSQPTEGGSPKQITNFTSESIRSFDLSRDGKQIAVSRGTSASDVVLISGIKK
jgi:Tol biopolymer transport system component